jgi:DNA polymerase-3 subunit delta
LILEVSTWPATTRLYQRIDKSGLPIDCRPPEKAAGKRKAVDERRIVEWLAQRAATAHDARLALDAGSLLVELLGLQFGLLDQELAKLALFAGSGGKITPEMVRDVTGGWRSQTIWELLDLAAEGKAAEALRQLDLLMQSGEPAAALFGSISWSLRRFAAATRLVQRAERVGRRVSLPEALKAAGFREWPAGALAAAERQIKQLGRDRAGMMYRWLLEADLALKGSHSHGERSRWVLERLILRMAKAAR